MHATVTGSASNNELSRHSLPPASGLTAALASWLYNGEILDTSSKQKPTVCCGSLGWLCLVQHLQRLSMGQCISAECLQRSPNWVGHVGVLSFSGSNNIPPYSLGTSAFTCWWATTSGLFLLFGYYELTNVCGQVSGWTYAFISLGLIPRNGTAESHRGCVWLFEGQQDCSLQRPHHLTFLLLKLATSLPTLVIIHLEIKATFESMSGMFERFWFLFPDA